MQGTDAKASDQKIVSPTRPTLVHLDLQGNLVINMTIPASELTPMTPENKLGQGGFGVVYKGIYNDKPVAIKQLTADLSTGALQELKREAEIMFQLRHHVRSYRQSDKNLYGTPLCAGNGINAERLTL